VKPLWPSYIGEGETLGKPSNKKEGKIKRKSLKIVLNILFFWPQTEIKVVLLFLHFPPY
jgi:hypothetical protein